MYHVIRVPLTVYHVMRVRLTVEYRRSQTTAEADGPRVSGVTCNCVVQAGETVQTRQTTAEADGPRVGGVTCH